MWTHAITFSTPTVTKTASGIKQTTDVWGDPIRADFQDTTRNDEVAANQLGYTADVNIEIHKSAYAGQSYLRDEATLDIYDIKRTYNANKAMNIILTCSLRERGKVVTDGQM